MDEPQMTSFVDYAQYYDLIYTDKDYQAEANFVDSLIQRYAEGAKSILDLGCGTGRHTRYLSKKYSVTGVDMSEDMLGVARSRPGGAKSQGSPDVLFLQGDLRTFRVEQHFDAVVSLFHVMSYQTTNEDLRAAFATAKAHLRPGGVFLFDCWYGPAVLTDRPAVRSKRLENERLQVIRVAEPLMYPNENRVDVNYTVWIKDKQSNGIQEIRETHKVRYWFLPELVASLHDSGFKLLETGEWMTGKALGWGTWSAYFVAQW
jgi:SAM-dependent methyltransferase